MIPTSNKHSGYERKFRDNNLMELSGFACAKELLNYYGPFDNDHLVVYAGPGKNGGDGIVTSFFLAHHAKKITIYMPHASKLTYVNENIMRVKDFCQNVEFSTELVDGDIYIDALFGAGINKKPEGVFANAIKYINQKTNPVVSIDIPSGANSEIIPNHYDCVKPDLTLAIGNLKPIHNHANCGNVVLIDIGPYFLQKEAETKKVAC